MSSCLQARTGRDLQRYENHFRLVAGCIPYRIKQHAQTLKGDLLSKLEVLMITSPNRLDLVFPKGGWENDETMDEAASREALEEAGVLGIIHDTLLGVWEFRSKSKQKLCGQEGACRGYMFALEVTEELQCWPEQSTHDRKWLNVWEAWKLCRYDWMREALNSMAMLIAGKPVIMIAAAPEISSEESSSSSSSSLFFHVKPSAAECAIDSAINAFC